MNKAELREKIEKVFRLQDCNKYNAIDEIITIFAPELEKAKLWTRVKEIANAKTCSQCVFLSSDCLIDGRCCYSAVVDALEGEKP